MSKKNFDASNNVFTDLIRLDKRLKIKFNQAKKDKRWTKYTLLHLDYGFVFTRSSRGQRALEQNRTEKK